jgi:hypothetical protein
LTDKWLIRRSTGRKSAGPSRCWRSGAPAVLGVLLSFLATWFPAHLAYGAPVEIGELTPFYRSMQMQGHILGHGLIEIPAYLTAPDIDIRYRKNPNLQKEIPFVDSFTINRFLGGYKPQWLKQYGNLDPSLGNASLDYVIRDRAGQLENRPDIIRLHLQPYIEAGYKLNNITINLENVPWAIARDGGDEGSHGQRNPPATMDEWKWTVSRLAEDLKSLYGEYGVANFKVGNEFNTKKSFNGTANDYLDFYTSSYKVLRENFPTSAIVPGEFTGNGTCRNVDICVYDTKDFLPQARALGADPSYVPRSLHAFQNVRGTMPSAVVQRAVTSYQRLGRVTAEIHQFGLAGQPFGAFQDVGNDMGPRQAAWQFQVLMGLQEKLRPARVFHWGGIAGYQRGDIALLNGTGFLRLFLDRYLGAKMSRLRVTAENPGNTEIGAAAFTLPNMQAVIVGSFGPGTGESRTKVAIEMPGPGDVTGWKFTRLSSAEDVFMAIRRDLAAAGNLKPQFDQCPTCTGEPQNMAINPANARRMISAQQEKYERIIQETLRWKPLEHLPNVDHDPRSGQLRLELAQNELLILESPENMR